MFSIHKPKTKNIIEFVAYTLEEPPYYDTKFMGSRKHAELLDSQNISVRLMLSLEMIGYFSDEPNSQNFPVPLLKTVYPSRGNFIALVSRNQDWSITRTVKLLMQSGSKVDVFSINTFEFIPGIDWSDHRSYWAYNIPAIMITDTSFYRNKNYHKATDTVEKLDLEKMGQVISGVYSALTLLP